MTALLLALSIFATLLAAFAIHKSQKMAKIQKKLLVQMEDVKDRMSEILWQEKTPYVRYSYTFNKAREHQFDIEIINILDERITLLDLQAYPQGEKLSYSEIALPADKDSRPVRMNYNDKISLDRIKTSLNLELASNQRSMLKYSLKFKDSVFTAKKPNIFVCYQSNKHPEIKEIRIPELETFMIKPNALKSVQQSRVSGINVQAL